MSSKKDTITKAGMSRRKVIKTAAGGAAVLGASPFLFNIAHADSHGKIKIGMPVPLTGPYGKESQEQARCAQIAVDQFNAAGGMNGVWRSCCRATPSLKPVKRRPVRWS